jgi:tetratricopeptide (TPR) repeat protein
MAKADPKEINAILQSAKMAHKAQNLREAEGGYRRILSMDPRHAEATYLLGLVALGAGMVADGIDLLEKAVALDPKQLEFRLNLARAHRDIGHMQETAKVLRGAIKVAPNEPLVLAQLADVLKLTGDYEEALELVDRGLVLNPRIAQFYATKATTLEKLGRYDEAVTVCREAFKLAEDAGVEPPMMITMIFGQIAPRVGLADEAFERVSKGLEQPNVHPHECKTAMFALAAIEAERENHEKAFELYQQANSATEKRWRSADHSKVVDNLIAMYSPERVQEMKRSRNASETPIFIVGMPRSGTTLVEQILGAHPEVEPFGELLDVFDAARRLSRETRTQYMTQQFMDAVSTRQLDEAAQKYLARHRTMARNATRVTDKLPTNFLNLGLIAQMLPGARVIHCVRDPMDSCWSNFTMNFTSDLPFARDLSDLGHYYRDYERLMEHYKQVLGLPILDVRYEDLIDDIEGQSKRMLDFLDVDWDERVLRYYESDRRLLTASAEQATKPIYTSSIGRYKPYEPMLGDLKAALEGAGAPG